MNAKGVTDFLLQLSRDIDNNEGTGAQEKLQERQQLVADKLEETLSSIENLTSLSNAI